MQEQNVNATCWDARLVPVCLSLDGAKNELDCPRAPSESGKYPSSWRDHEINELELFKMWIWGFRLQKTHIGFLLGNSCRLVIHPLKYLYRLVLIQNLCWFSRASTVLRCSYSQFKSKSFLKTVFLIGIKQVRLLRSSHNKKRKNVKKNILKKGPDKTTWTWSRVDW